MNKWKALAILFTVVSFGAVKETLRIFTSTDADIADNRSSLIPMGIIMTGLFVFFAIRFWRKSSKQGGF
jgi:hypothetical protein